MKRVWSRRDRLPWGQRGECAIAVRPHPKLEPAIRTEEGTRAKIQLNREQPAAHKSSAVGNPAADLVGSSTGGEQGENQVIVAVGGVGVVNPPALIREHLIRGS